LGAEGWLAGLQRGLFAVSPSSREFVLDGVGKGRRVGCLCFFCRTHSLRAVWFPVLVSLGAAYVLNCVCLLRFVCCAICSLDLIVCEMTVVGAHCFVCWELPDIELFAQLWFIWLLMMC